MGAIHIFNVYKTDFSRSVLRFGVNCAFLAVRNHAIATDLVLVSLEYFASAEATRWLCPLDPCHPLKSVDVNFIFMHS